MDPEPEIVCPDCGGTAHLVLPPEPGEELEAGEVVTYRCEDCGERFDVVVTGEDVAPDEA